MKYKMIACDLDGTMFGSDYKVCERNLKAIKSAVDGGLVFAIASGRPCRSILKIAEVLGLNKKNQYIIGFNGALIAESDSGRSVYSLTLGPDEGLHIINAAAEKEVSAIAYIDGAAFSIKDDERVSDYSSRIGFDVIIDKARIHETEGFDKVLFLGEPDELKTIEDELSEWAEGKAAYVYTDVKMLEFFDLDASKGGAMLFLADKLGIKKEEVIAIGDYYNDLSMIAAAGLGVAVKGAPDAVKASAGYVTKLGASEGAVSEVIEKFISI